MSVWSTTTQQIQTSASGRWRGMLRTGGVVAVYLTIAAVYTRPLLELGTTRIAGDPGDPVLNASILWWNATAIPFTERWWNPPYFHLTKNVSAFTENLVGISPVATPLYWLTRNPLTTYNVTLFLTWPLSALTMFLLVQFLTARGDAAFLAGLAYGFTPYRTSELGHIQMLATFWMPLTLLGLHGYLRQRRAAWLILFGVSWTLQSLANGYLMLFGAVLIGLWLLFFCSTRESFRALPAIVVAWGVATIPLLLVMLKYRSVHEYYGLRRSLSEVIGYSVPARAWLETTGFVWLWRRWLPDGNDDLFPGITALALVALGVVISMSRPASGVGESGQNRRRLLIGLGALTTLSIFAIVVTLLAGPWRLELGTVVLRMSDIERAVPIAVVSGLSWLLLMPRTREALRRRSALMFYTAATVIMAVLSCGPILRVGDTILFEHAPYRWLMQFPGFLELRVPSRFWTLGVMCLATAAGLSFGRLRSLSRLPGWPLFVVVAFGLLLDGWLREMPMAAAPTLWPKVERRDQVQPILELPLGPEWDAAATFRSIWHQRGVFNGVSGYDPPHYAPLREGLNARDPAMLRALASFGSFDVVVDGAADRAGEWARYVSSFPGVVIVASDGERTAFRVPASHEEDAIGGPLPIVRADAFRNDPSVIADGRVATEWADDPQRPGQWVSVDLGVVHDVGGVTQALGEAARDFPRRLAIDVSLDGSEWDTVWEGPTAAHAFRAAVVGPREATMRFAFAPRPARFVRLRQLAKHKNLWRVAELGVHGVAK